MKRKTILALYAMICLTAYPENKPWCLSLVCPEENLNLHLDLYEESIEVPGLEMFGPMNGYMDGDIYGVWYVTSSKIKNDREATIKMGNELGSENQKMTLIQLNDSTWKLRFEGYNAVKRVRGKKLVKTPSEYLLKKK